MAISSILEHAIFSLATVSGYGKLFKTSCIAGEKNSNDLEILPPNIIA